MLRRFFLSSFVAFPFVGCLLVAGGFAAAADLDPAALQKVVAESTAKYAELFAKRDAAGLAALFTPEAEYVNAEGEVFHGRAVIEAELAASLQASPGTLAIQVTSIRPIADGLIVEEGASTFQPADDGPVSLSRYLALHSRQSDGTWLMAAVRELAPAELSAHEQLKSLAWLIGDWREESADGVVKTSWKRSDDGVALLAEFTLKDAAGQARNGTHRIGWDAERKQFRSWIFDATGGFADGWWTPDADGSWSVQLNGIDAEGVRIAATLRYFRDGADVLTIAQENRTRGGEGLPSVSSRMVRKPPEPAAAAQ